MDKIIDRLLSVPPYGLSQPEKEKQLLAILLPLINHHQAHCSAYQSLLANIPVNTSYKTLADLPFVPARLFKDHHLQSVPDSEIVKTLHSSGTTGQTPAHIYLDKYTARLQTQVLVKILQDYLGKQRLPMLIIDSATVIRERNQFNARAAGILGLAQFGRDHTYALDADMQLDCQAVHAFLEKYQGQRILMFGFTFMVWKYFYQALKQSNMKLDLQQAILLHSGGWKQLIHESVDNTAFKQALTAQTGLEHIHNFYGMVEQVGSIFVECAAGYLHASIFSDIIIRNTIDWQPVGPGEQGVIEVLSVIPRSYPGHIILSEDLGTLQGEDDCVCGRSGRYFSVAGRLAKSEIRGCSDTQGSMATQARVLQNVV